MIWSPWGVLEAGKGIREEGIPALGCSRTAGRTPPEHFATRFATQLNATGWDGLDVADNFRREI
jgi:hypothetical protein